MIFPEVATPIPPSHSPDFTTTRMAPASGGILTGFSVSAQKSA